MNTALVKQLAIAKILGAMLEGTCKYGTNYLNRWDDPIEPDEIFVNKFRHVLGALANKLHTHELTKTDVEKVIRGVNNIGHIYGHITGSYRTGIWGVRLGELEDIIELLSMPEGDLLPRGTIIKMYNRLYGIDSYKVTEYHLGVYLDPVDKEENKWSFCVDWKDIGDVMAESKYLSGEQENV